MKFPPPMMATRRAVLCTSLVAVVAVTMAAAALEPLAPESKGNTWTVLVAGTNKFANYRHQAEVCHAYQILKRRGVNANNIITMMYDDVAGNPLNPVPGELVNIEGGPNLYPGVVIDYAGVNVTMQNFMNVVTGNKEAMAGIGSGRVLQSGPDDHVMMIYTGRGAVNFIVFPDGVMTGEQLVRTLQTMSDKQMFAKMLLFVETCKAGTLFMDILPRDINVLAMSGTNSTACAYVSRWSEKRQVWLADVFTVAYLEEIESTDGHKNGSTQTLGKLFREVSARVAQEGMQPARYGQDEMGRDKLQAYFGAGRGQRVSGVATAVSDQRKHYSSEEATFQTLKNRFLNSQSAEEDEKLIKEMDKIIKGRRIIDTLFERVVLRTAPPDQRALITTTQQPLMPRARPCYAALINNFHAKCVNISENLYTLEHVHKLSNLCWAGVPAASVLRAFQAECAPRYRVLVGID